MALKRYKKNTRILIIGAGPTGLGAAYRLKELGHDNFRVYEKNNYAGGLCASFKDNQGFTWDLGGHVIFSHFKYFNKLLRDALKNDFFEHKRKAWIRTMDRWIPYPFQKNIRYLPKNIAWKCLEELKKAKLQNKKSINFEEWIVNNLGAGIAKYFMLPYNFKVWAHSLRLLSADWIAERVSRVDDIKKAVTNLMSNTDDTNWGPNLTFRYPAYGGTGEIFRRIGFEISDKITFNSEIAKIDTKHKRVYLTNCKEDGYDVLINTSPLDKLLALIKRCNKNLLESSRRLKHNGVFIVGLGINKPSPSNKCWMYFPDSNSPFFRVTYLSNYSANNVPNAKKYYSLLCENAYSEYKKENRADIVEETIQGLINTGIINKTERKFIISRFLFDIKYAYPIPTLKRDEALRNIQPELEKMDIYSRGRFGAWKYEVGNTDHSVMQGKEIADRIFREETEKVWRL